MEEKHTLTATLSRIRNLNPAFWATGAMCWSICPGYRRLSRRRYPVLYLHDGQNVFDAATSFAGVEWGVDETAQRLIPRT